MKCDRRWWNDGAWEALLPFRYDDHETWPGPVTAEERERFDAMMREELCKATRWFYESGYWP